MSFIPFRKKFPHLRIRNMLHGGESFRISLSDEELRQELEHESVPNRFLGRFSEAEVIEALDIYGIWKTLNEKGYPNPGLLIRSIDPFRQSVRILTTTAAPETENNILAELRVYSGRLHATPPGSGFDLEMDALIIDWLEFQNPHAAFTGERPPLPGQRYPGLGILRASLKAIEDLAVQIEKDAIITTPEYYHNAVLYHPEFLFLSPEFEGFFRALRSFLSGKSLAEASHAVAGEKIFQTDRNRIVQWTSHEQIHAIASHIRQYFTSRNYRQRVGQAEAASRFEVIA